MNTENSINRKMQQLGSVRSAIRDIFEYGLMRAREVGPENILDFSLGNPSVPAPEEVDREIARLAMTRSVAAHGYTPAIGLPSVRKALAQSVSERYHCPANPKDFYLTCGAAASLTITLKAILQPGDEVAVIAPFFPEYRIFIESMGGQCRVVEPDYEKFEVNFDSLFATVSPHTKAVIINSPNNPTGVILKEDTIRRIAAFLKQKEEEYDHPIFLMADEPYRELVYDDTPVPYIPLYYDDTIVCYSYSKALSLPGERIGYIFVPEKVCNHDALYEAVAGAGRALGFVCAPSMMQQVIEKCGHLTSDIAVYKKNRDLLYTALTEYGYESVYPDGAFYLFVKVPGGDAEAFCKKAMKKDLLLVPSDSFGCPGYMRIAYCVPTEKIEKSLPLFKALLKDYG